VLLGGDFVDQAMLDVEAPREGAAEVADQLLERRWCLKWVGRRDVEQLLRLEPEPGRG